MGRLNLDPPSSAPPKNVTRAVIIKHLLFLGALSESAGICKTVYNEVKDVRQLEGLEYFFATLYGCESVRRMKGCARGKLTLKYTLQGRRSSSIHNQ